MEAANVDKLPELFPSIEYYIIEAIVAEYKGDFEQCFSKLSEIMEDDIQPSLPQPHSKLYAHFH